MVTLSPTRVSFLLTEWSQLEECSLGTACSVLGRSISRARKSVSLFLDLGNADSRELRGRLRQQQQSGQLRFSGMGRSGTARLSTPRDFQAEHQKKHQTHREIGVASPRRSCHYIHKTYTRHFLRVHSYIYIHRDGKRKTKAAKRSSRRRRRRLNPLSRPRGLAAAALLA